MRRRALLPTLLLATTLAASIATPAGAQGSTAPRLEISLPVAARLTAEGPLVRAEGVLSDARMRELLRSGFPARLSYRVELWSSERWLDQMHRVVEWEVQVRWRGVDQKYEVTQFVGGQPLSLGAFEKVEDAEAAVERPLRPPISAPISRRRFYYQGTLEVRTLSVSDLDEVNGWLRGELQPAVRGERNPGTAFTRGLRSLTTRLLGGERREYATRTGTFRIPR
ncbi:MAG: hypothetical protein KF709_09150 [Gemmatimonadaceae bacterium]|nr:hypothetical protein [Gemmatimonadaceae bacterium]